VQQPSRPQAGGVIDTGHDFAALDQLLPHPVYGWMSWVAVINPSATTFEDVKPLLSEAYSLAVAKFINRTSTGTMTCSLANHQTSARQDPLS